MAGGGQRGKKKKKKMLEYFLDGWPSGRTEGTSVSVHTHTHTHQPHTVQTQRDILYKHAPHNTDMEVYADQGRISIVHGVSGRAACD